MSQYDPPSNYGIPNPYGPRLHNWKGGPLNEGSLYHGPIYTRPMNKFPWMRRPLNGAGQGTAVSNLGVVLPIVFFGGLIVWAFSPEKK